MISRIRSAKSSIAGVFAVIVVAAALIGSLILIAKNKLQEKATTELVLHNCPSSPGDKSEKKGK